MSRCFPSVIVLAIMCATPIVAYADATGASQSSLSGKLDVLHQDLQAVLHALKDSEHQEPATKITTVAPSAARGNAVVTEKFFPIDPGLAEFPSPENSRILRTDTGTNGRPYLLDANGAVHKLVPVSEAVPNGYTVNDVWAKGGGSDHSPVPQLLVRQGKVFAQAKGGPWQLFNSDRGSLYNISLPDAF